MKIAINSRIKNAINKEIRKYKLTKLAQMKNIRYFSKYSKTFTSW